MLSDKLIKLYNTLALVETKGESTKIMAQCMVFVEQLATEVKSSETQSYKKEEEEK